MPRLIKCPSCGTQMDVGAAQPGSIVACPGCQVKIRIPTGKTSVKMPAVGAGAAASPAAGSGAPVSAHTPSRGLSRPMRGRRRGMRGGSTTRTRIPARGGARGDEGDEGDEEGYGPPPKKSNTGLIIGIVAGVVVVLVVVIIVVTSGGKERPLPQPRTGMDRTAGPAAPTGPISPAPVFVPPTSENPDADKADQRQKIFGGGALTPQRWEETINALKRYSSGGYGSEFYGEYEDPEAKMAFDRVKSLGPKAYPYLVADMADPEIQRGKGAIVALKFLCGDQRKGGNVAKLNPGNCGQYQSEWKQILGVSDADVQAADSQIKSSAPAGGGGGGN